MRTLRTIIGLPVVVNSRRIGRVFQAELTEDYSRLKGIWVDAGLSGTRFISSDSIALLGQVAVVADDRGERKRCRTAGIFRRAVSTDGKRTGAVTGVEIDEISFRTEALELSRGVWDDLSAGRQLIRQFTLNPKTGDVIIDDQTEKEDYPHEERHDEGSDYRRNDRRLCSHDVRHHELAVCPAYEPADEEDRPLDRRQDG